MRYRGSRSRGFRSRPKGANPGVRRRRDIQIVDWQADLGRSGNELERAGLQAVLAAAQAPDRGFDVVVVYSLDRLARRVVDMINIEATLSKSGVRVLSVEQPKHDSSPELFVPGFNEAINNLHSDAHA